MKVSKWGNSLAIRLPADMVAEKGIKEGDEVEAQISLRNEAAEAERKRKIDEAWKALDEHREKFRIPADYKFDRDEANSRG